jgi:hypothetical protein
MPEIASISEDFPALCQPMAAIAGISRSTSTLEDRFVIKRQRTKTEVRTQEHAYERETRTLPFSGLHTLGPTDQQVGEQTVLSFSSSDKGGWR